MNISNLPTEINLLMIDFLKLQDIINLASVNHYYHKITADYLEKYHEFNKKCRLLKLKYKGSICDQVDDLKSSIIVESVHFGYYNICEFVFDKCKIINNTVFQKCLIYACKNNKAKIIGLIINNNKKMVIRCDSIDSITALELFEAICVHNYTNVLEFISPHFSVDDYVWTINYAIETDNITMYEALIVQDNFQLNDISKGTIFDLMMKNKITTKAAMIIPYLTHETIFDIINDTPCYENWLPLFKTPYAIDKIFCYKNCMYVDKMMKMMTLMLEKMIS